MTDEGVNVARAQFYKKTPSQIYSRASERVVIVGGVYKCASCGRWHVSPASGFVIGASGVVATNYHVVNDREKHTFLAMTQDRRIFP